MDRSRMRDIDEKVSFNKEASYDLGYTHYIPTGDGPARGRVGSKKYMQQHRRPETLYGEPSEQIKGELWTTGEDLERARAESRAEGGPRAHFLEDPELERSLMNANLNFKLDMEVQEAMKKGATWNDIADIALSDAPEIELLEDRDLAMRTIKNYRVLYYKLLNLPRGLINPKLIPRLINVINRWGGIDQVGKARRKTHRRKGHKRTMRKK
jgi:hypothetical protein